MFRTTMYRQIVFVLSLKKFYFLIFFHDSWRQTYLIQSYNDKVKINSSQYSLCLKRNKNKEKNGEIFTL